jgi:hypothetical protein
MRAENQNRPSCSCWCGKRQLFLSALSLCLSRACLGKMIVFSIEWCNKRRVRTSICLRACGSPVSTLSSIMPPRTTM